MSVSLSNTLSAYLLHRLCKWLTLCSALFDEMHRYICVSEGYVEKYIPDYIVCNIAVECSDLPLTDFPTELLRGNYSEEVAVKVIPAHLYAL